MCSCRGIEVDGSVPVFNFNVLNDFVLCMSFVVCNNRWRAAIRENRELFKDTREIQHTEDDYTLHTKYYKTNVEREEEEEEGVWNEKYKF